MAEPMKIRASMKGDVAEIKCLMNHVMETGLRKDSKTGQIVPAHFITNVTCDELRSIPDGVPIPADAGPPPQP